MRLTICTALLLATIALMGENDMPWVIMVWMQVLFAICGIQDFKEITAKPNVESEPNTTTKESSSSN